jgi:DNA-binding protein H-NS
MREEIKVLAAQENKSILQIAHEIVHERRQEKERQYGPFEEGMEKTAKIASLLTNKDITAVDIYLILTSLKLSRESYNHKEDNLLDAVAYIGALNKYLKKK